jgi:hypothetical protein
MTKYSICKFTNGNGGEYYQIKMKWWFFWSYLSSYSYVGVPIDFPPLRSILRFESFDKAKSYIDTIKYVENNKTVKKVECFDYVP